MGILGAFAQKSILRNGDFEEHGKQICLVCNNAHNQFASLVYHWDNGNGHCVLCDTHYKPNSDDQKTKFCPLGRVAPQSGNAMISMIYDPSLNGIYHDVVGASHLSAQTITPMHVGKLYEISFWLYIESGKEYDPEWESHLGIALLPQKISYFGYHKKKIIFPFIPVDTVIYGKWYQAKWLVRPLCNSNYLMIGIFSDLQWPNSYRHKTIQYYLDRVSVLEYSDDYALPDSSIYYCSRYDPVALGATPLMDSRILLYENDAYELNDQHRASLDTFVTYAQKYPGLIFELSGHTDSTGEGNLALSQRRVQTLYKYLVEDHQLPGFRFYALALGATSPYRSNSTEEGRKLNRRTEIKQTALTPHMMFYRAALQAIQTKNKAEAFSYLDKWLNLKNEGGWPMLLLFDPRFESLHSDKRWPMMEKKVRDGYKNLKYARESFLIDSLRLDACRLSGTVLASMLKGQPAHLPGSDNFELEFPAASEAAIRQRYGEHFKTVQKKLEKIGWPKKGEFCETAVNNTFHLMMNADDMLAYLNWLPHIEKACKTGDLPWIMFAKCHDKSRLKLGKPQQYLTDYQVLESGKVILSPWEGDENSVNALRAKIGLSLLPRNVVEAIEK